jgi:tellurite resistance protein TerC
MNHFGFPLETIAIFAIVIALSVYLDLAAHRKSVEITIRDAAQWAVFWIGLALCFYVYLWLRFSREWADLYLAGYVLEKSLSVDNLMVFIAIFASFGIKSHLQHRILYWGILGALVFRAIFVMIGTSLFMASPWVGFVFAAFVAWSAVQMLKSGTDEEEIEDYSGHWSVKLTGRLLPIYTRLHFDRFFVQHKELLGLGDPPGNGDGETPVPEAEPAGPDERQGAGERDAAASTPVTRNGLLYATPAFLCLMVIETSDIAFSFDSVPAVISVTQEPLLVYAAMIFAILGLRTLYFVIAALNRYLAHLEKAVIALLFFIAVKMALQSWNHVFGDTGIHISPGQSLLVILGVLLAGVVASLVFPGKEEEAEEKNKDQA